MVTRAAAFLVLAVAVNGSMVHASEPLYSGTHLETHAFVSGADLGSGQWVSLPLDERCRETISAYLGRTSSPAPSSEPVVPRVAPRDKPEPITTLKAIEPASEVLIGKIVHIEAGLHCTRLNVVRRIDIEVEEALKGGFSPGDRFAVLEDGGWFDAQGVRFLAAESSFYPPAAVGDRNLIAGYSLSPGAPTAFPEIVRFRLEGDALEPAGAPLVVDREPQSLSRVREFIESKK
jgi:hypothetical protein